MPLKWVVAVGIFNLCFGLFHLAFWRLLNWKEQLLRISPTNRAVMQALNLSLTFFFFLGAYLLLMHPSEIGTTSIGATVRIGLLLFWIWRTIQQVVLFDLSKPVHQILLILFLLGVGLHGMTIWG